MAPRTAEQNSALRDRSRERLLAAARQLFVERGFAQTTVAAIARRAGVSKGLLYDHFASKAEVLEEVLDPRWRTLEGIYQEALSRRRPEDRLTALVDGLLEAIRRDPGLHRLYLSLYLQPDAVPALRRSKLRRLEALTEMHERLAATLGELGGGAPEQRALLFEALAGALALLTVGRSAAALGDLRGPLLELFGAARR